MFMNTEDWARPLKYFRLEPPPPDSYSIHLKRSCIDFMEYAACFEEKNMYYVFNFICRPKAEKQVQDEPGYDYCKLVVALIV